MISSARNHPVTVSAHGRRGARPSFARRALAAAISSPAFCERSGGRESDKHTGGVSLVWRCPCQTVPSPPRWQRPLLPGRARATVGGGREETVNGGAHGATESDVGVEIGENRIVVASLVIEIESVGDVDQATDSAIFGCGSVVTASDLVGDRDCCVVNRVTAWTEQGRF
eukprot:m.202235 g.202235  ORF g.202235 m.202235 type:complete len:170 (-) comp25241_c0_seq33:1115-1624(-)